MPLLPPPRCRHHHPHHPAAAVGVDSMVGMIDDSYDHDHDHDDDAAGPSAVMLADILNHRGELANNKAPHRPVAAVLLAHDPNVGPAAKPPTAMAPRPPSGGRSSAGSRPSSCGPSRPATAAAARRRPSTAAAVRDGGRTSSAANLPDADDPPMSMKAADVDRSRNATPPLLIAPSSPRASLPHHEEGEGVHPGNRDGHVLPLPSWAPRHADVADVPQRESDPSNNSTNAAAARRTMIIATSQPSHPGSQASAAIASWQQRLVLPQNDDDDSEEHHGSGNCVEQRPIPVRPSTAAARVAFPPAPRPASARCPQQAVEDVTPSKETPVLTASTVGAPAAVPKFMRGSVFDRVARCRPASASTARPRPAATVAETAPGDKATARTKEERPAAWRAALGRATAAAAAREAREKVRPPPPSGQRCSSARSSRPRPASIRVPDIPFLKAVPTESYFLEASYADAVAAAKADVRKQQRSADATAPTSRAPGDEMTTTTTTNAQAEAAKRVRMQRLFLARTPADDKKKARIAAEVAAQEAEAVREVGKRRVTPAAKRAVAQLAALSAEQRAAVERDAACCIGRWWRCALGLRRGREARRAARQSVAARAMRAECATQSMIRLKGAIRRYLRERVYSVRLRLAVTQLQAAWRGRRVRHFVAPLAERRDACAAHARETLRIERASYATAVIGAAWRSSVWRGNERARRDLVARGRAYRLQRTIASAFSERHAPVFWRQLLQLQRRLAARRIQRAWKRYAEWREAAASAFCRRFKLAAPSNQGQ